MIRDRNIIRRWKWWPDTIVPIASGGFAWGMGWGTWPTLGAAVAAGIIAAIVNYRGPRPRGPSRWTE